MSSIGLDVVLVLLALLPPRPTASQYVHVSSSGTCEGNGYATITTAEACRAAAQALCGEAMPDLMGSNSYSGCITTDSCNYFWFKSDSESSAGGCDNFGYKCLCENAGGQTSATSCDGTTLNTPPFSTRGDTGQAGTANAVLTSTERQNATARFVCDADDTQSITYTCGAGGTFATTDAACPVLCDGTTLTPPPLTKRDDAGQAGTANAVLTSTERQNATARFVCDADDTQSITYTCGAGGAFATTDAACPVLCDGTTLTPPPFSTRGDTGQAGTANAVLTSTERQNATARFVCDVDDTQSITYTCGAGGTFATTDAACPVPCDETTLIPPPFSTRGDAGQASTTNTVLTSTEHPNITARFVCDIDDTQSITYTCGAGGTFATTDAACPVPNIPCDGTLLDKSPPDFSTRGSGAGAAGGTANYPLLTASEAFGSTIRFVCQEDNTKSRTYTCAPGGEFLTTDSVCPAPSSFTVVDGTVTSGNFALASGSTTTLTGEIQLRENDVLRLSGIRENGRRRRRMRRLSEIDDLKTWSGHRVPDRDNFMITLSELQAANGQRHFTLESAGAELFLRKLRLTKFGGSGIEKGGSIYVAGAKRLDIFECFFDGEGSFPLQQHYGVSGLNSDFHTKKQGYNHAVKGGAIFSEQTPSDSTIKIVRSRFEKITAYNHGGAIALTDRAGAFHIEATVFFGNAVLRGEGGALYVACRWPDKEHGLIKSTLFRENFALSHQDDAYGFGGAIAGVYCDPTEDPRIMVSDSRFLANSAQQGGAVSSLCATFDDGASVFRNSNQAEDFQSAQIYAPLGNVCRPKFSMCAPGTRTLSMIPQTVQRAFVGCPFLCASGKYQGTRFTPRAEFGYGCEHTCPSGSYCPEGSTEPTPCPGGTFGTTEGEAMLGGACKACPSGFMSDEPVSSPRCVACRPGQFQPEPKKAFCFPCLPGKFSGAEASTSCEECAPGQNSQAWKDAHAPDQEGASCSQCPKGFWTGPSDNNNVTNGEQIRGEIKCLQCPKGWEPTEVASALGRFSCNPCPRGKFNPADEISGRRGMGVDYVPTDAQRAEPVGHYYFVVGDSGGDTGSDEGGGADEWGNLADYDWGDSGDSGGDAGSDAGDWGDRRLPTDGRWWHDICQTCPSGYGHDSMSGQETSCQGCAAGKWRDSQFATIADMPSEFRLGSESVRDDDLFVSCYTTMIGRWYDPVAQYNYGYTAPGPGGWPCSFGAGTLGMYAGKEGTAACVQCSPGKYRDLQDFTTNPPPWNDKNNKIPHQECSPCKKGKFSSGDGATSCAMCPIGYVSALSPRSGSSSCNMCGAGSYGKAEGSCEPCESGRFRTKGTNSTFCEACPLGQYQPDTGSAACLPCLPGQMGNATGQRQCHDCLRGKVSASAGNSSCSSCPPGRTSNPGSAVCTDCAPGQYIVAADDSCRSCEAGKHTPKSNMDLCLQCGLNSKGETSAPGANTCAQCELGRYQTEPGICQPCPPGTYQDGKGEKMCIPCPVDTYGVLQGATSKGDCRACEAWEAFTTTSERTGISNRTEGCRCAKARPDSADPAVVAGFYHRNGYGSDSKDIAPLCVQCPKGGSCHSDGMTLAKISAQVGWWRPHGLSTLFSSCKVGYKGLNAAELAKERCCPMVYIDSNITTTGIRSSDGTTNITATVSLCSRIETGEFDPDQQCLVGYAGALCRVCADGYVRVGDSCNYCPAGKPTLAKGMVALLISLVPVILFFVIYFAACAARKRSDAAADAENSAEAISGVFGQAKILLSFLQITGSMPGVMDGVNWPASFVSFTVPMGAINLDVMGLFQVSKCDLAVPFHSQFILHMLLLPFLLLSIAGSYKLAHVVRKPQTEDEHTKRHLVLYKSIVLIILFIYPGICTRVFSLIKCIHVDGVDDGIVLEADFAVRCFKGEHLFYSIFGFICMALYVVGIPGVMLLLLFKNRAHLHNKDDPKNKEVQAFLGGLYTQYEVCKKRVSCAVVFAVFAVFAVYSVCTVYVCVCKGGGGGEGEKIC